MKKAFVATALSMYLLTIAGIVPAHEPAPWYGRGSVSYERRLAVVVRNRLRSDWREWPVVLNVADLRARAPGFPGKSFVVVEAGPVQPVRRGIETSRRDVPSQLNDLDGNGAPDELMFLADLPAGGAKTFHIYYTQQDVPMPRYPKRTQATTFAECDANSLFAIESDVLMFRLAGLTDSAGYGFDVYGKYREYPGYYQHLFHQSIFRRYGPRLNGDPTADTPRGRSLLYPEGEPGQIGLGSLFIRKGEDAFFPPRANVTVRLADGTIRSMAEVRMNEWRVGENVYEATIRCMMYAGHPYLEYRLELRRVSGSEAGDVPCLAMMTLENERRNTGAGYLLSWGDRPAIGAAGVGLGLLYDPRGFLDSVETEKQVILPLNTSLERGASLRTTFFLSGAWGKGGYFATADEFFDHHRTLSAALRNPPAVEIGTVETGGAGPETEALSSVDLFVTNVSNRKGVLPAECDLESLGYQIGGGVSASALVDAVRLYGRPRVFIGARVEALKTEIVAVSASGESSESAFDVRHTEDEATVTVGATRWVIGQRGLKRLEHNGKELKLGQSAISGLVKVLHNGAVCAIVRVGGREAFCDYYFYRDERVVKVVTGGAFGLASEGCTSYVAKKEVGVEGTEQTLANRWGRIASEKVFGISSPLHRQPDNVREELRYPAEWGALHCGEKKVGLVFYGTPSAERIEVEKGGRMESGLVAGRRRQTIYLSPIEEVEQGEERWTLMSPPFVSARVDGGFVSREDRTGSGVEDTVFIEDLNGNGRPDFVGDRWRFDAESDGGLQMVVEFGEGEDRGRPGRRVREMRVYCDTVTGTRLHSSSLGSLWGDLPTDYRWTTYPEQRDKYDGVLGPGELQRPFSVYQMIGAQDGTFFNGPVFEGGFVDSGRITDAYGGPFYRACFVPDATLEALDLDGDGDCDIWVVRAYGDSGIADHGPDSPVTVAIVNFDLSDNGLDPVTVVSPYAGRAYWATRYSPMQSFDNTKYYQQGVVQEDGTIVGGRNWPMAGTWDADNSGIANAHLYHETARPILALDLDNRFNPAHAGAPGQEANYVMQGCLGGRYRLSAEDLEWVEGWNRQKDLYPNRPWSFVLHGATQTPIGPTYYLHSLLADHPRCVYEDPYGNRLSIRARYIPEQWSGERLECREWSEGQWDYWPSNNWNAFFQTSPWMCVSHHVRGWHMAHMEGAHDHVGFLGTVRTEMAWASRGDPDGASSYTLYYSPIMNGLHYLGLDFGLQNMPDYAPGNLMYPIFARARTTRGMMAGHGGGEGGRVLTDYPPQTRQWGNMFLYYLDRSGDGYADTYLLDSENDGYFEKRAWHDRQRDLIGVYDHGRLGIVKRRLGLPAYRLELKNYAELVRLRRESYEKEGLLWTLAVTDGLVEGAGDDFSMALAEEWLPRVAVDAFHTEGGKDAWADFEETGLDTLGRVLSQSAMRVEALKERYTNESLSAIDLLVIADIAVPPDKEEVEALRAYLEGGGRLLLLAGAGQPEALAPIVYLARCFGVVIKQQTASNVPEETELTRELRANRGYLDDWSRIWGPYAEEAGVSDFTAAGLLKGVKALYFDSRDVASADVIVDHKGHALILSKTVGNGMLVVVPSNLFHNKYMCMDYELRELLTEKAGNQRLAENLAAYLLGGRLVEVTRLDLDAERISVGLTGKGGEVRLAIPWPEATVSIDGKESPAEFLQGGVAVVAPSGGGDIVVAKRP